MPIEWVLDKAMVPPPKPSAWHENPDDPEALTRVYGKATKPAYEYPEFNVAFDQRLRTTILVKNPKSRNLKYAPFKDQFNELCDELIKLRPGDKADIIKFRDKLLCGYSGDTSSKYSHQESGTFAEIKYNLEVVINHVKKHNDESTLDQVTTVIAACEGGTYQDLDRLSKSFTEPNGILEFLEKERVRIIDALAQKHIALAEKSEEPITEGHLTHVSIFFAEVARTYGIALPEQSLRDVYIPVVEMKTDENNVKAINFVDKRNEIHSIEAYQVDHERLNNIPKDFHALYTAPAMTASLASYLNERLVILYNQYQSAEAALKPKRWGLRKEIEVHKKYLSIQEKALAQYKKDNMNDARKLEPIRKEKERLKKLITMNEEIMVAPWHQFQADVTKMLSEYQLQTYDRDLLINCDMFNAGSEITLKPHETRMYQLYAVAAGALSSAGIVAGITRNLVAKDCILVSSGTHQWFEDKSGLALSMESFLDQKINIDAYINNITDRKLIKELIAGLQPVGDKEVALIKVLADRNMALKDEHNRAEVDKPKQSYIIEDLHDIEKIYTFKSITDKIYVNKAAKHAMLEILFKNYEIDFVKQRVNGSNPLYTNMIEKHFKNSEAAFALKVANMTAKSKIKDALALAADKGWGDAVTFILKQKPEACDNLAQNGAGILKKAVQKGYLGVVSTILAFDSNHSVRASSSQPDMIRSAISSGNIDIVKALLKEGYHCSDALTVAARLNRADMVKLILSERPHFDPAGDQECATLQMACHEGYGEIVELLVNKGVALNIEDALSAAKNGHITTAGLFKSAGANLYADLMMHPKVHTLADSYGYTVLCDFAGISASSDDAFRLYAKCMLLRLNDKGVDPTDASTIAKMNAFTEVLVEEKDVLGKLAIALEMMRPPLSWMLPSRGKYIPSGTPSEIAEVINPPSKPRSG